MAKRIRVMHICDKFGVGSSSVHGVARLFSWWLPRFDRNRFEVSLVGLRSRDRSVQTLEEHGVIPVCLGKGKFDPSTVGSIIRLAREKQADILHLHGYGASNFGLLAAWIAGTKCIVHEHFVDPHMPAYQVPVDFLLTRRAGRGIAVCEAVKEFMVEKRFLPADRVEVVFNGAPLAEFKPKPAAVVAEERQRLGIPDDQYVVATVGRLDEQKGNRYFIEAAKRLIDRSYKIRFLIVGDGPLMEEHRDHCRRLGLTAHVLFTGYCSNVPLLQSLMDVQVFPSLWEGTPLTLFEAMSVGVPIVSTDVDGLGEVVSNGRNGLVVPAADAEALANGIKNLLDNEEKRRRLASQAQLDSKEFDIQKTVDRLQDIYAGLVN